MRTWSTCLGTRYNPAMRAILCARQPAGGVEAGLQDGHGRPGFSCGRAATTSGSRRCNIPQVEFQTGLHPDYHTENDTWQRINYPKLTKIIRLVFLSVADMANSNQAIAFVPAGAAPGP